MILYVDLLYSNIAKLILLVLEGFFFGRFHQISYIEDHVGLWIKVVLLLPIPVWVLALSCLSACLPLLWRLHWLGLPVQYWIQVLRVDIPILFLILGKKYSVFHLSTMLVVWFFFTDALWKFLSVFSFLSIFWNGSWV